MAKNWTLSEAVEAINTNDKEGIADLGKRFPNVTVAIAQMGDNKGAKAIIDALPDYVTARKVEAAMKGDVETTDTEDAVEDTDADEDVEEAPKKRGRKAKADSDEAPADDKKARAKARREARKAAKKAQAEADDFDEEEAEDEEATAPEDPYAGMNAVDLFKLCKKRGIKAQPKQKAATYIELLKAEDAKAAEAEDTDEADDDWGDDEEEEVMPTPKKAKKEKAPKASKKAAKEEEDEDDDWDI